MTKGALVALKVAVPLILAFFIGRLISQNWEQVRAEPWQIDPAWLGLSFLLGAAWYLVRPLGWAILLQGYGHEVPYADVYRVYRKAELGRYVPGTIWQFAARVYLTRYYGVSAGACLTATLLDMTLAALAALLPAVWLSGSASNALAEWQVVILLVFPVVAFAIVYPPVLNAWVGRLARKLGHPFQPLALGWVQMLGIWAMYMATWWLLAFSLASMARGLLPSLSGELFTYVAGSYALAWVAALLTMVAPAGIGVREGILGLLLVQIVATGTAVALAVAIRLWLVVMELVWLAAAYAMPRTARAAPD